MSGNNNQFEIAVPKHAAHRCSLSLDLERYGLSFRADDRWTSERSSTIQSIVSIVLLGIRIRGRFCGHLCRVSIFSDGRPRRLATWILFAYSACSYALDYKEPAWHLAVRGHAASSNRCLDHVYLYCQACMEGVPMKMSNHPASANPAMTPQCRAESQWRRFAERNRSVTTAAFNYEPL